MRFLWDRCKITNYNPKVLLPVLFVQGVLPHPLYTDLRITRGHLTRKLCVVGQVTNVCQQALLELCCPLGKMHVDI